MRFKEYFADGLLNIAILLSLLRTDLNNVVNQNYIHYPEVQEILLGQTTAYTLTNFNNYIDSLHGYMHPKSPDNDIDMIIQDLRSLGRFSRWQRSSDPANNGLRRISAFLASRSSLLHPQINNQIDNNNNNENGEETNMEENPDDNDSSRLQQDDETESTLENDISLYGHDEEEFGAASPFQHPDELSSEDLDLIDVLWRQDIDLGVGKEVFDINLRQELERERELELQKDRQKQKERELSQRKQEEQQLQQQRRWMSENFMQDTETGEWVPLRGRGQTQQQPPVPNNPFQNRMPFDNNMTVMNEVPAMEGDYRMPQFPDPSIQYQHAPQTMVPTQTTPQQMTGGYMPTNYSTPPQNMESYSQMESLDERWQDILNLLELPDNETQQTSQMGMTQEQRPPMGIGQEQRPPMGMGQEQMVNMTQVVTSPTDTSSVLIQNATLPVAPQLNNTLATPFSNTSVTQQPMNNFTSPRSTETCSTPLDWEHNDLFFNNGSGSDCQADPLAEMENILPDIIPEDGLEDYNLTEVALNDGLRSMRMLDDNSSESGVSMGSSEQDQFSDSAMSPFDGLEGATGGQDYSGGSPGFNKSSNFDHNKYNYNGGNSFNNGGDNYNSGGDSYSSGSSSNGDGAHSSSNDTDFGFAPTKTSHIRHNHSYPLQPGQEPREYKKYSVSSAKQPRHKGPQCKDQKRIEELKVPLTVEEIVDVPVEEFNELLTRHKLTEPQLQLIRDIRRRGKNKVAAQNCRKRKLDVIVNLEDDMTSLKVARDRLLQERHLIDKQTREMKDKFSSLYREIFQSLRDEHGRPYDPHLFSLQQSSDGNVFLVPRNITADEQQAKGKKKKSDKK